jgi:hypothetical protein
MLKDSLLKKFGVTPQRCLRCKRRFYLYRPILLHGFLRAFATRRPAPVSASQTLAAPQTLAAAAGAARNAKIPHAPVATDVVWSTFAKADQSDSRP